VRGPKAPSVDPQAAANAAAASRIADRQVNLAEQQYADQKAENARLQPQIDRLLAGQIQMDDLTNTMTKQSFDDYNRMYRPNEERYMAEVSNAGTQSEQDRLATQAGASVQSAADRQRQITARSNAAMGVSPDSGRAAAGQRSADILAAATEAGAMEGAAATERTRGTAMRGGAVATGRGLAGMALTGVQQGNANAGAVMGTATMPGQLSRQAYGDMQGGLGGAAGTYSNSTSQYLGVHGARMQTQQAQRQRLMDTWRNVGTLAKLGASAYTGGLQGVMGAMGG
jgi:hypothetical protein